MNIYRIITVNERGQGFDERFICAKDVKTAYAKYFEVIGKLRDTTEIRTFFVCRRDEIIPTVEPITEFV